MDARYERAPRVYPISFAPLIDALLLTFLLFLLFVNPFLFFLFFVARTVQKCAGLNMQAETGIRWWFVYWKPRIDGREDTFYECYLNGVKLFKCRSLKACHRYLDTVTGRETTNVNVPANFVAPEVLHIPGAPVAPGMNDDNAPDCPICMYTVCAADSVRFRCTHLMCRDCFLEYVQERFHNRYVHPFRQPSTKLLALACPLRCDPTALSVTVVPSPEGVALTARFANGVAC
jgi:hypothetical protein